MTPYAPAAGEAGQRDGGQLCAHVGHRALCVGHWGVWSWVLRPLAGGLPGTAGQEASTVGHLCPS